MKKESNLWNTIANKSDYQHKNLRAYMDNQYLSLIKRWTKELKYDSVLKTDMYEESYGKTKVTSHFLNTNFSGMDISKNNLKRVRINLPKIPLTTCDVREMPFKDSSFSLVLSLSTLDHIKEKDFLRALKEIQRILKKDGRLIISLNNKQNIPFFLIHKFDTKFRLKFPSYFYTKTKLKKILKSTDFKILDTDYVVFIPPFFTSFLKILTRIIPSINPKIRFNIKNQFLKRFFSYYIVLYLQKE